MPPRRLLLALPVAALLAFLGSGPMAAEPIRASGTTVRSQSRPAAGFDAIEVRGGLNVVLRQGVREAVEVRADDDMLALIETRVVPRDGGATLEIGPAPNGFWSRTIAQVTVDLVQLKALALKGSSDVSCDALKTPQLRLEVYGSGDVRLRQLDTDDLGVRLAGSGDLDVAGSARQFALSVAGSGDVNASRLVADTVSVSIAGSGDASVNARRSLAVSIAGSGDVTYTGDAAVQTSIAGSGTVSRR